MTIWNKLFATFAAVIRTLIVFLTLVGLPLYTCAEGDSAVVQTSRLSGTTLTVEVSGTAGGGDFAPLWLSSNRYGLASVRTLSSYERLSIERPIALDAGRTWRIGYGLDLAAAQNHERAFVVQQAYAEVAWKRLRLTLGSKQQPMETKPSDLSSGALSMGINARPIPQMRLDVDWFNLPGMKGWWQWKLYGSYGWMTDGRWQANWAEDGSRYARHTLYHEKGLFWKFGRLDRLPFTYEIGIRMASQFGGTSYNIRTTRLNNGSQLTDIKHSADLKAYWHALICQGSDETDGSDPNTAGNTLGSYVMAFTYHGQRWQARAYWERYFEDQSMLTVQYGIRDMLIGGEVRAPQNPWADGACLEFITTTNQSGAVYHDRTAFLHDKMNGRDNYYNHQLYAGWQHYGFTLGNPLLTSPLYNPTNIIYFQNNRIKAWHVGLTGQPSTEWRWRALGSFTRNWGRYTKPFDDCLHQQYFLLEATYTPQWAQGWKGTVAVGIDHGPVIGNNTGVQLTVRKAFAL